jgi:glycosyltransferase involved in cell wall biosynthesis
VSAAPLVSVLVPTHDRPETVVRAVRGWRGQRLGGDGDAPALEVVVVVDGASPATVGALAAAVGDDPLVAVHPQAHAGPAVARNRALDQARGRYVLFADDDVVPADEGVVARWLARAAAGGAWAARMTVPDELVRTPVQAAWRSRLEGGARRHRGGAPMGPGGFWFAALLVERAALRGERFATDFEGYGWEDMEMGWRLHRTGLSVRLADDVVVRHEDRPTLGGLLRKHEAMGRAAWTFARLHPQRRVALWTGTARAVRWGKRLAGVERRGAAAAARLGRYADRDGLIAAVGRDLTWALEGAYARGVREAAPGAAGGTR